MGIIQELKTRFEQNSERKLISKKLGINACCVESGIYDKEFLEGTNLTSESFSKIIDMYIDELVDKIENNNLKKRKFFEKVDTFSTDLTKGLSREELKEKIKEEMQHMFYDKKVDWNLKQGMLQAVFNEIKLWVTTYGVDRLLNPDEIVRLEIAFGIDKKRYEALKSKGRIEIDEEEIRKEIYLAKSLPKKDYENYKNIELLKNRYQSLLLTNISENEKTEIREKIEEIQNLGSKEVTEIGETIEQLYFDYEIMNRNVLLENVYTPSEDAIINNRANLNNMLVHFFDDSRSMKRFSDTYKSKMINKIKKRAGKKDEQEFSKYENQEVENALKDYVDVKTNPAIVSNSANVELNASCGFDYSVKSNVSNQISASVVKEDILSQRGINVGIGFDKSGLPIENIATISDRNIYSNQGLENVPTENEFDDFSSSAFSMMSDDKRKCERNEVVMFRNTEETTLKPSYFLCVCNADINKDQESKKIIEEYRKFAKDKELHFIFVDAYEINKDKTRTQRREIEVER